MTAITAVTAILIILFPSLKTEATAPKSQAEPGAAFSPEIAESTRARFYCEDTDEKHLLPTTKIPKETSLSPDDVPVAGIVSHHILAHSQIDGWFAELAAHRPDISTFLVLSPSHWNLSTGFFSVTFGSWIVSSGANDGGVQQLVDTDFKLENRLKEALDAKIDDTAFASEHGVSALAPYIKKYFPNAKIAAVIYSGEPPVNQPLAEELYNAVKACIDPANPENGGVFLLVSSDFSHHQTPEVTRTRDDRSRLFLEAPSKEPWILAVCDNRPAMYTLQKLLPESIRTTILCNTNSYELSSEGADDITSYFFCFFSK